jgi:hypothetical protein
MAALTAKEKAEYDAERAELAQQIHQATGRRLD